MAHDRRDQNEGDGLAEYRQRRDFGRTPEPRGHASATSPGEGRTYLIQKHAARRLHYDLRLELDGVLKSWAVTRGPSLDPAQRRLAVRTEDHPLDYGRFEGVIPAGLYGAGTVMLWDRGTWEPRGDPREALGRGLLKIRLEGERLQGGFVLVRLPEDKASRRARPRENWLLIKERDRYAEAGEDALQRWTRSVTTGRSLEEIRLEARAALQRLPGFVDPQLARPAPTPPSGPLWLHEIKYDGYRAQLAMASNAVRINTRSGRDWTGHFPGIVSCARRLAPRQALIDGEIILADRHGISRFGPLQRAIGERSERITLMAFDLLALDGEDLRMLPLSDRKQRLRTLLKGAGPRLRYTDHEPGDGPVVLEEACRMGLEGIVSKRADLPYRSGRSAAWVKTRCLGRAEFVIGGWRPSAHAGRPLASLLVGQHDADGQLRYRGRVGSGFGARALAELGERLRPLRRPTNPFLDVPAMVRREACWTEPTLVAEIAYTEITGAGLIRHGRFLGLRTDKEARDVLLE